ncbi:YqzE family protein [Virgibacillus sp. W0430]|uniref:YqzE family protein n=1 Tax=Virgibacillus sp. W0430 TaxID=3391580 RepID=UPI003F4613F7
MSFNDLVKYITQQFVTYMDTPAKEREARKQTKTKSKTEISNRWFGVFPLAIKTLWNKKKSH